MNPVLQKMISTLVLVGAFLSSSSSSADSGDPGDEDTESNDDAGMETCTKMQVIQNLDMDKLKGTWFEWSSHGTTMMNPVHRCQVGFWYPGSDGKTITALNDFVTNNDDPEGPSVHERNTWNITDEDPATDGNLVVNINTLSFGHQVLPFYVLDTDYNSFLLIHMCKKIATFDYTAGFILTRHNSYSKDHIKAMDKKINKALKNSNIEPTKFNAAIQSNCEIVEFPKSYDVTPEVDSSDKS